MKKGPASHDGMFPTLIANDKPPTNSKQQIEMTIIFILIYTHLGFPILSMYNIIYIPTKQEYKYTVSLEALQLSVMCRHVRQYSIIASHKLHS